MHNLQGDKRKTGPSMKRLRLRIKLKRKLKRLSLG